MRRFLLLLIIPLLSCTISAQPQRGVKGEFNTSNFPEVSFVWNSPNPDILQKSMFELTDENGQAIDFQVKARAKENKTYKKSVLFLWEDMKSHSKQSENTRTFLVNFFKKIAFDKSTVFNVAVFNRKSDLENSILKPLLPIFSADRDELLSKVAGYKTDARVFQDYPMATDLYSAIDEGINLLKKEPSGNVGVIVVITAGRNMKASGASSEMTTVLTNAQRTGIPIFVFKYHQVAGDAPDVNSLAERTYGKTLNLTDNKIDEAVKDLQEIYKSLDSYCYGQDYEFSFQSTAPRDGKAHRLHLSVNKTVLPPIVFSAPRMTLGFWIKEHILIFILLMLLFLALIAVAVWFILRNAKNRREREAENKAKLQQEIDKANQERSNWMNMQQQKEEAKLREEAQKAREAEENRLLQLMHTKNLYPRLKCNVSGTSFTYTICKVATKLGRNEGNDVVLPSNTVSGVHAEIIFNGTSFEVFNRSQSYSQGIIVNGQFFQQCTLKSGDMIGLGEAVISFYV